MTSQPNIHLLKDAALKNLFREHYQPTAEELEDLWSNGLIVLDTNVLLNFFRYAADTRDEFLSLLEKEQDRIWIPHQVGLEFHCRHLKVSHDQEKIISKTKPAISTAEQNITKVFEELRRHAPQVADELSSALTESIKDLREKTSRTLSKYQKDVLSQGSRQNTLGTITKLYDQRVGSPYSPEQLAGLREEGKERYANKVPPGYEDAKKDDPYGDLILWRQMLDKAKEENLPMIFVTADLKEDWWQEVGGKTIGPRSELIKEYYEASEGKRVHFYEPKRFLSYAKEKRGAAISDKTVEEAGSMSAERRIASSWANTPLLPDEAVRRLTLDPELISISQKALQRVFESNPDLLKESFKEINKSSWVRAMESLQKSLPSFDTQLFGEIVPSTANRLTSVRPLENPAFSHPDYSDPRTVDEDGTNQEALDDNDSKDD